MSDAEILLSIAKSKATANRLAKAVTADQLSRAIENLSGALAAAKKREQAKMAKRREANIKKLTAMMADMGLSPKDVVKMVDGESAPKAKRGRKKATGPKKGKKVAPKYQIFANGENHQWTGRGRMPVVFKEFVENGGSLEQCLIQPAAK